MAFRTAAFSASQALAPGRKDLTPDFGRACNRKYLTLWSLLRCWKLSRRASGHGIDQRRRNQELRLARGGFDQNGDRLKTHTNRKTDDQADARQCECVKSNVSSRFAPSSHWLVDIKSNKNRSAATASPVVMGANTTNWRNPLVLIRGISCDS